MAPKKQPEKPNSTRNEQSTWAHIYIYIYIYICFFTSFQGAKIPNINSPHQMKQFDTNIVYFNRLNWCQQHISLSSAGLQQSLSVTLNKRQKITKTNFCTKIKLKKYW